MTFSITTHAFRMFIYESQYKQTGNQPSTGACGTFVFRQMLPKEVSAGCYSCNFECAISL